MVSDGRNQENGHGIRQIPGRILYCHGLLRRGSPWGSGRRPDGAAFNAQRPTRQWGINAAKAARMRWEGTKRAIRESAQFQILVVDSLFRRPAGFRGVPRCSAGVGGEEGGPGHSQRPTPKSGTG